MNSGEQNNAVDGRAHRQRAVLVLVVLATALASLEVGLVTVALPTLADTFNAAPSTVQWVAVAYQLAIVGTLILFGRLVDVLGGRALYLAGMVTIGCAALLAAVSPNLLWLVASRGLLGLGAAMLLATGQALITTVYGEEGRGRALGFMHMAVAGGLMSGPALGGLLLTAVDWRAIFVAPIPFALGALYWGWRVLPVTERQVDARLDVPGAALMFLSAGGGVFGLTRLATQGWNVETAAVIAASMVAFGLFLAVERRHPSPLVDLSLLGRRSLTAGLIAAFLTFIAMASNMFLIPFSLQDVLGYSAAGSGLMMMVVPLAILPVAPIAGTIADRYGVRVPTTAGLAAVIFAIIGMSQFVAGIPVVFAIAMLALYGVGAGLFQAPNNSAVLGAAPRDQVGIVSGMLALSRNLGQVLGIAIASTLWAFRQSHYEDTTDMSQLQVIEASLGDTFLVLAGAGVLALVVSLLRK